MRWAGWECESENGLHVVMSKRHLFRHGNNTAVCGATPPAGFYPRTDEGDEPCKKCQKWEHNNCDRESK